MTGVQTCALPISKEEARILKEKLDKEIEMNKHDSQIINDRIENNIPIEKSLVSDVKWIQITDNINKVPEEEMSLQDMTKFKFKDAEFEPEVTQSIGIII